MCKIYVLNVGVELLIFNWFLVIFLLWKFLKDRSSFLIKVCILIIGVGEIVVMLYIEIV